MKRSIHWCFSVGLLFSGVVLGIAGSLWSAESGLRPIVRLAELRGMINPATSEYLAHAIQKAEQEQAQVLIIELDTPGGLLSSVREMAQSVGKSGVPVAVYVAPAGASATSAGALLMLSAQIAAMAPGTNVGAAHPVGPQGEDVKGVMGEKVLNDTTAFARGLAEVHGRNREAAEKVVSKSASYTAEEALKEKLIDLVSPTREALIQTLNGREVKLADGSLRTLRIEGAEIKDTPMSIGLKLLNLLSNPNISAILMTLGMLLIYIEASHPGQFFPGILGIVCLITAFMSFQTLPIRAGGMALLAMGIVLMLVEPFVTTKGALAAGGLLSFILGLLWVVDPAKSDFSVSWAIVIPAGLGLGTGVALIGWAAARTARLSREARERIGGGAHSGLSGYEARVEGVDPGGLTGTVSVRGEIWRFESKQPVREGEIASVSHVEGMKVFIRSRPKVSSASPL